MASFSISVDLSALMTVGSALTRDTFPHLATAVQGVTDAVESHWKQFASGMAMPNGRVVNPRSGQYARSIMQRPKGDFASEVFSELPYAQEIEEGAPRRDMKTMLNSSLKVRISAAGKRYLVIPFRHSPNPNNVMRDNAMPASVHNWWKGKTASHVLRRGTLIDPNIAAMLEGTNMLPPANARFNMTRPSGTGVKDIRPGERFGMRLEVARHQYSWGDRLSKSALAGLGVTGQAAQRMEGMVHFTKKGSSRGSQHSRYITFRTMTEGSKGWIRPATEGKWPARQVAEIYTPVAEELFKAAVEADIRRVLPGATD